MSNRMKAFQLTVACEEKAVDENGIAYTTLDIVDADFTGALILESNGDDIDSLFGLGLCYEVEVRCHDSNDQHNAWPRTQPVSEEAEEFKTHKDYRVSNSNYIELLESVADAAEQSVGFNVLGIQHGPGFADLKDAVDALKAFRGEQPHGY